MGGDLLQAIEDPDVIGRGEEDQILTDGRGWNRVVVAVEADPESLGAAHRDALTGVEGIVGQGQQTGPLLGLEDFGAAAGCVLGPGTSTGDLGAPAPRARIEGLQGGKALHGKERLAQKADGALDAPLFVATGDVTGTRLEAVVTGQLEIARMETDLLAPAFEHDRA